MVMFDYYQLIIFIKYLKSFWLIDYLISLLELNEKFWVWSSYFGHSNV